MMLRSKRRTGAVPERDAASKSRKVNDTDANVGERLRQRCLQLRISKTAVARAIGVTIPQILKYERGENRISAARLHKVAELLDVPIEWFFDRSPPIAPLPPGGSTLYDQLMTAFQRLGDPADQHLVVSLAERLARRGSGNLEK